MSQNPYDPNYGPDRPGNEQQGPPPPPPPGNGQPGYGQPGYGQPGHGTQPPPPGYSRPVRPDGGLSTLQLNLWLSVFFSWIPALIFFLTERDQSAPAVREAHTRNMNFALVRVICAVVTIIPFVGWVVGPIATAVLFVFAIVNAVQVPQQVAAGRRPEFVLGDLTAPNWVK